MIEDMENTVLFDGPVEADFMGKKVIRFRSKEKVKMKEFPDYRLRLWEIYPSGKGRSFVNCPIRFPEILWATLIRTFFADYCIYEID